MSRRAPEVDFPWTCPTTDLVVDAANDLETEIYECMKDGVRNLIDKLEKMRKANSGLRDKANEQLESIFDELQDALSDRDEYRDKLSKAEDRIQYLEDVIAELQGVQ